jgi:hypothetical protein
MEHPVTRGSRDRQVECGVGFAKRLEVVHNLSRLLCELQEPRLLLARGAICCESSGRRLKPGSQLERVTDGLSGGHHDPQAPTGWFDQSDVPQLQDRFADRRLTDLQVLGEHRLADRTPGGEAAIDQTATDRREDEVGQVVRALNHRRLLPAGFG